MQQQPLFNELSVQEKTDIITELVFSSNVKENLGEFEIANLIFKIKSDLNRLEKLILIPEIIDKKPEPIHWDKGLRDNSKSLVLTLIQRHGKNKIQRNSNSLKNLLWEHRVTDLAQLLKTLEQRKFCKIEYIADSNRIEYFSFIKP